MASNGPTVLSKRALNRALLARQMLLKREKVSPLTAIEKLVGLQAQIPRPPFMGLWTRLDNFQREGLLRLARDKKVVRATTMRGTIHLMTTEDFLRFRPVLADMLVKGAATIVGKNMRGMDMTAVYAMGREFFETPAPFDDFRKHLDGKYPDATVRAVAYAVRMGIPLVVVPEDVQWGWPGNAGFVLAEKWLGKKVGVGTDTTALEEMVLRYLAAFGPASSTDSQKWSALQNLRPVFEKLRPQLVTFRDERKRELFDLPKAPRPDGDTPAPVRFLPEYDNTLLSHDDRTRIVADEHRQGIMKTNNLQVIGTFLVDGFVAGIWRTERKKKEALLMLKPVVPIAKKAVAALEEEGESLLEFLEPGAASRAVRVVAQGYTFR